MNQHSNAFRVFPSLILMLGLAASPALAEEFELVGNPADGEQPYQLQCASCHGPAGAGDGPAARAFDPPPSDLTRAGLTAEHMFLATRDGGLAVGLRATMPAFKRSFDEQTIHDIVAYIKSLGDES